MGQIIVTDVQPARLEKARQLGATGAVNAADAGAEHLLATLAGSAGYDIVVETTGTENATRQAMALAKSGANIVLVGYSKTGEMTLPWTKS